MSFLYNLFGPKKKERGRHPANPYILYYMDMRKQYGGNIFALSKVCAQNWKNLPLNEKLHYKRQYIQNRAMYGTKYSGGYKKPSQPAKWRKYSKVARRTVPLSKKKQKEMAAAAAAAEEAMKRKDAGIQVDSPMPS